MLLNLCYALKSNKKQHTMESGRSNIQTCRLRSRLTMQMTKLFDESRHTLERSVQNSYIQTALSIVNADGKMIGSNETPLLLKQARNGWRSLRSSHGLPCQCDQ